MSRVMRHNSLSLRELFLTQFPFSFSNHVVSVQKFHCLIFLLIFTEVDIPASSGERTGNDRRLRRFVEVRMDAANCKSFITISNYGCRH